MKSPAALVLVVLGGWLAGCRLDVDVLAGALPEPSPRTLSSSYWHTCAVKSGGLWCWGRDDGATLGPGITGFSAIPVSIAAPDGVVGVQTGSGFSCALLQDRSLACWGSNVHGQLGQNDAVDRETPTRVSLPDAVSSFDTGSNHVCAVLTTGQLFCWGDDDEQQLGLDEGPGGPDQPAPVRVGTDSDWHSVFTGDGHTCALKREGTMMCWGRNSEYECGGAGTAAQIPSPATVISSRTFVTGSCGERSTCALDREGAVWCWGDNPYGQLGISAPSAPTPTLVIAATTLRAVDNNAFDTCTLSSAGLAWCWGYNEYGELGLGDQSPRPTPVQAGATVWESLAVGRQHICGRMADDSVWCAGRGVEGQLGDGTTDISPTWRAVTLP